MKIGLRSRSSKKKPMTKPISRKKLKEKEFQDLMSRTRKMTGWRIEAGVKTDGDIDDSSLKQDPGLPTECGTPLWVVVTQLRGWEGL